MHRLFWLFVQLVLLQSCGLLLDFDPPDLPRDAASSAFDATFEDADTHHDDADIVDARADGSLDSSLIADASGDASFDASSDASFDADPDAALDTGPSDSGEPDSGFDSGPPPPCGGELGLCLELTEDDPLRETASWRHDVIYTRGDGTTFSSAWAPYPCIGGIRTISSGVTQCLLPIPPPGEPTVGVPLIYAFPVMDDGMPWCTRDACPGFHMAYRVWMDGTPVPTDPVMGHVNLERRTDTSYGVLMCLRITP